MTQSIFCTKNEKKKYLKKWHLVSKIVLTYCEKKKVSVIKKNFVHKLAGFCLQQKSLKLKKLCLKKNPA